MSDDGGMSSSGAVRPSRARQTLGDMARSLGLMAVVITALLLLGPAHALLFPGGDRMAAVDFSHQVRAFAARAGTPALAPVGSPAGWRATTASLTGTPRHGVALHIGWATPGSHYAGLDETSGDGATLVHRVLGARGTQVVGTVEIVGVGWLRRVSQRGEESFSRSAGSLTVVLTGNATDAQLRLLAASLR